MGGRDVSYSDSDRYPDSGRPRCCMIQFGQIELKNHSAEDCSGPARFAAGHATRGVELAGGFSVAGRHQHFCRSSGGIALVRHPGVCEVY